MARSSSRTTTDHEEIRRWAEERGAAPAEVPQLDDRGVNEALGILTGYDLVRPVARMRPFAVLS